jgi:hypothetical protein
MNISESYKALKSWSNEHYGLIALAFGVVSLGLAFIQTNRLQNQAIILDYKMSVIESKLDKNEELERERIAYSMSVSRDLKEIKGYVQGVSDKHMQKMVERMPVEFK